MKRKKKFLSFLLTAGILTSSLCTPLSSTSAAQPDQVDSRAYMHGINLVQVGDKSLLVFSSYKYTQTLSEGEWVHDIYYSWIDPADPEGKLDIKTLVSDQTAQEPASAAVNSDGIIAVTAEDAQHNETLDQTFGLWSSDLTPVKKYGQQLMPPAGGHSGHIAASGKKFLVTFCDGWIDGGGVNNLGTGDDIYCRIINEDGTTGELVQTRVDSNSRDWWPVVAGSDTNWLQVWQQYGTAGEGGGTVWGAITTVDGTVKTPFKITDNNKYYYYDVSYIPSIERYLVTGSRMDGGFAALIDKEGNIKSLETGLPYTAREAKAVARQTGSSVTALYPALPGGVAVINIENDSITLKNIISVDVNWDYMGTDGMFTSDTTAFFATGTNEGIKFVNVNLNSGNGTVDARLTGFSKKLKDPAAAPVIAFLGDSITEKNSHTGGNSNYVEYLTEMFKSINPNTTVINAGVSGDTTELALERLKTDVIDKKPDVTFIMLGVNDGSSWYPEVTVDQFTANYRNILDQVITSGSEVVLMTQNDVQDNAYHGTVTFEKLPQIEQKILEIAGEKGLPVIDCYSCWNKLKANNINLFRALFSDSVHPNGTGHMYYFSKMRSALLKLLALPGTTWGYNLFVEENKYVPEEVTDDYSFLENLALNKTVEATEEYDSETSAQMAVDGDYSTRWDSKEGTDCKEPVNFTVDLGEVCSIKKVVISWDSAAAEYNLLFSTDGINFDKVFSTTEGGQEADETVSVSGKARYVRFEGVKREVPDWGYSFTEFAVYGSRPFETSVSKWFGNKKAAYTVGFAGGFEKSLNLVKPLMDKYGIKGTAYINSANVGSDVDSEGKDSSEMASWNEYKALAQNGTLQLGYFGPGYKAHFVEKDGSWSEGMNSTTAAAIITNGKTLIENETGNPCEVMAGNDYFTNGNAELAEIMKDNFLAVMAGDGFSPYNAWNTTDYNKLGGYVMYPYMGWETGNSAADMNAAVDEAIKNNSLLSIESRGVFDEAAYPELTAEQYRDMWAPGADFTDWWLPVPLSWYESNFKYVQEKSGQLWNDSLSDITKYMRERDNAVLKVQPDFTEDSGTISLSLPDEMVKQTNTFGKNVFDQKLTLNTAVPNDWASATVRQGDEESRAPVIPYVKDGKKWISYDAEPGKGNIHISVNARESYASLGKVKGKVTKGIVNVASDHKRILDGEVFELELTNATLRDTLPENSVLIDNLPEGFSYEVTSLDVNRIQIKINGSAKSMLTRPVNMTAIIRGKCVNELEATDSAPLSLQIAGSLSAVGESEITPWKNNKTAAYTATYDDGIINSLKKFETLHKKYGFPATIALAPTFIDDKKHPDDGVYGPVSMGSWEDFRELLKSGVFEVSSHMMNHAMAGTSGNYKGRDIPTFIEEEGEAALQKDFADSKARLEKELAVPCDTIIYPHYDTNDEINAIAERVFIAARTGGDEYDGNSPDDNNYYELYAKTFYDKPNAGADHDTTAEEARTWLDTAIQKGKWLITVGHGCDYEGWGAPPLANYDGFYSYVSEKKNQVWADTLANISKYMKERNSANIVLVQNGDAYTVTLTDTLDNTLYNQELTIKTKVNGDWNNLRVIQNGKPIAFTTTNDELGKYVYYNVLPDSGAVTVDNNGKAVETTGGSGAYIPVAHTGSTVNNDRITAGMPSVENNIATAEIEKDILTECLKKFDKVIVDIPKAQNAEKYYIKLPEQVFNGGGAAKILTLNTEIGSLQISTDMLSNLGFPAANNVTLCIGKADIDKLSDEKKSAIGNRPVVELNVKVDGKDIKWSNSSSPVLVSIPYSLTEQEKNEDEFVTAWYIADTGEVQPVCNSKYDKESGRLLFKVTHFSSYAVALVHKNFDDLNSNNWAKKQIEVLASKGIMESYGTKAKPQKNITRSEFVAYLVRGLGLNASFSDNFIDVKKDSPYYNEIGTAKKLGIVSGTGENRFGGDSALSRQDMMVIVNNTLRVVEGNIKNADTEILEKYSDAGSISGYARQSIANLVSRGIVGGTGKAMIPRSLTTRAQAAAVIYNLIK